MIIYTYGNKSSPSNIAGSGDSVTDSQEATSPTAILFGLTSLGNIGRMESACSNGQVLA